MKNLLIALLLALPLLAPAAEKPNLIYILLDDAGYGDIVCYGQEKFPTPNIDRLATEGMKFDDAHSGHCLCTPSRYSMLPTPLTCPPRSSPERPPSGSTGTL